ncbi:MAG: NAD-dependent dehydratase [Chitinophagaceae bacterium]|nr:MAG: NAD-dependent dehydratase [Chitinophagaceae bacterium]
MKITITGSLGNIGKPLAQELVAAGHEVTVISSKEANRKAIEEMGAKAAIGAVQDIDFLTRSFTGADTIFTMVPPDFSVPSFRKYIAGIGENYATAIQASGVKNIVNLSSIGAHLPAGTGPIAGLYDVEQIFNKLQGITITHLRPAFFYVNFYANADMIRHANILGANYGPEPHLVMVHPADIAHVAAKYLQNPPARNSIEYIVSDERSGQEIASVIGAAVGKPELPWVDFTDEQSYEGMVGAGLPPEIARNYTEMGVAVRTGILWEDYVKHTVTHQPTKLEDFAKEFAVAM